MATYNGARFIKRQLDSIISQIRLPDEIVISDDCSIDETLDIISEYQNKMIAVSWIVVQNQKNLGWRQNFANAIRLTTGDIIFLADQDDEWNKNKIKEMSLLIQNNEDILLLVSGYVTIEETSSLKNKSLLNRGNQNGAIRKIGFDRYFYMNHYPGCTYAFRKECKDWFSLPIWSKNQAHDEFIMVLAKLKNRVYCYDKPLIYFIRHETSATYGKKLNFRDRIELLNEKNYELNIAEEFLKINIDIIDKETKNKIINECKEFIGFRIRWLEKPNCKSFLKLISKYRDYEKIKFFFTDIYCAFKR